MTFHTVFGNLNKYLPRGCRGPIQSRNIAGNVKTFESLVKQKKLSDKDINDNNSPNAIMGQGRNIKMLRDC